MTLRGGIIVPSPGPCHLCAIHAGMRSRRPVIGIPADRTLIGLHPFHAVGEKYIHAIARAADAVPLLIPVLPDPIDPDELLASVDAVLFTGSPSNV